MLGSVNIRYKEFRTRLALVDFDNDGMLHLVFTRLSRYGVRRETAFGRDYLPSPLVTGEDAVANGSFEF